LMAPHDGMIARHVEFDAVAAAPPWRRGRRSPRPRGRVERRRRPRARRRPDWRSPAPACATVELLDALARLVRPMPGLVERMPEQHARRTGRPKMGRDSCRRAGAATASIVHFANEPVAGFESDISLTTWTWSRLAYTTQAVAFERLRKATSASKSRRWGSSPVAASRPRGKHQLQGRNRRRQRREVEGGIRRLFVVGAGARRSPRRGPCRERRSRYGRENFRLLPQSHRFMTGCSIPARAIGHRKFRAMS